VVKALVGGNKRSLTSGEKRFGVAGQEESLLWTEPENLFLEIAIFLKKHRDTYCNFNFLKASASPRLFYYEPTSISNLRGNL